MTRIFIILFLLLSFSYSKTIITISYPVQEYFIKKIANNKFYIKTVFSNEESSNLNNKKLIDKLSTSKAYLTLGLKEEQEVIEKLLNKNKDLKIINTTQGVGSLTLTNGQKNSYVWLDPILSREFAKKTYETLVKLRYYDRNYFKTNYELLLLELDKLYLDLKKRIDQSDLYGFFVFNNKFDYFAKRYRINIYHRNNRRLFIDEISSAIKLSRKEHISHILINTNFDYSVAQSLSGHINGKIVEVDIYDKNWKITLYKIIRGLTKLD